MKKYYAYFASYSYTEDNVFGLGNIDLFRTSPLSSVDEIRDVEKIIAEKFRFTGVVVINFALLCRMSEKEYQKRFPQHDDQTNQSSANPS